MKLPWVETNAFRDRVVIITGGGRAIGANLALRFAQAGASVVVNDLVEDRAQEVANQLRNDGFRALASVADITKPGDVRRLFDDCAKTYGGADVFISSAGFAERRPILDVDEVYWNQTVGVNLKGPFFCLQQAARQMVSRGGGRIVLLTSVGAHAAQMHLTAYCAAKAGLVLVTKSAAVELAPHGITVNAVGPGAVKGPWNQQFFKDPEYRRRWMATAPLRRMAENDDVAGAVMFLASDQASYITGQVLYVEGGKLAYVPSVDVLDDAFG